MPVHAVDTRLQRQARDQLLQARGRVPADQQVRGQPGLAAVIAAGGIHPAQDHLAIAGVLHQHSADARLALRLAGDDQAAQRPTGDERWDALLAAVAEHLAAQHDLAPPEWAEMRVLQQPWFPAELEIQRADALVWGTSSIQEAWRLLVRQGPGGGVSEADSIPANLYPDEPVSPRSAAVLRELFG